MYIYCRVIQIMIWILKYKNWYCLYVYTHTRVIDVISIIQYSVNLGYGLFNATNASKHLIDQSKEFYKLINQKMFQSICGIKWSIESIDSEINHLGYIFQNSFLFQWKNVSPLRNVYKVTRSRITLTSLTSTTLSLSNVRLSYL